MSNRLVIQPTKFIDLNNGVECESSCGVRVYDNYSNSYSNTWETIPEDPLDILRIVCRDMNDDSTMSMLDSVQENELGLSIGNEYFEWEQVKDIICGEIPIRVGLDVNRVTSCIV